MLLWVAFAALTAGVLAFVLAPLIRPARSAAVMSADHAVAVYRDQLKELDAEQARGLIPAAEAEAARLEISRRLLAAAGEAGPDSEPAPHHAVLEPHRSTVSLIAAAAIPLLAIGLYVMYGSPGAIPTDAQRAAAREQAAIEKLVAQVEDRLRTVPTDGKGWEVIAPVYLKLGRFQDAADAYARSAKLLGETPARLAGLAESSMLAAGGLVTSEARAAYEKLAKLEPTRIEPRFWLAMAKEQAGDWDTALAEYKAILTDAPSQAPYRPHLEQRIRDVTSLVAARAAGAPTGPTVADIAAAAKLDPAQRAQMITQMVESLAARLKSNGNDLPSWLRLVRAYAVLDRRDDAKSALAEARRNFTGNAEALAQLAELASSLGLDA
jgi:cytochrome c-type biogenesis protein CcmH